jgi:hypothetical protein
MEPVDHYYLGHALRYAGEVTQARAHQRLAEIGFSESGPRAADPERLAGAILEQGVLDLNQGRFSDALGRGSDLVAMRGRYAIQRWGAWGHWLLGAAHIYQLQIEAGMADVGAADDWFAAVGDARQRVDGRIMALLAARVSQALGVSEPPLISKVLGQGGPSPAKSPSSGARHAPITERQRDDIALVEADIALGQGRVDDGARLVSGMTRRPATTIGGHWAELVRTEVTRSRGGDAIPGFTAVAAQSGRIGATWLQLQAVAGLARCGAPGAAARWDQLAGAMQLNSIERLRQLTFADRPLLWAVT